jgi:molybdopterin molybdotransferase
LGEARLAEYRRRLLRHHAHAHQSQPLAPGAIYDSNRFALGGLLQACGCVLTDLGRLPDRLDATRSALRAAAQDHDLVLSSGGVSVGEEDHVKAALRAEGRLALLQLAIKPGKPLAFGALARPGGGEALFVGLPGNPVSAFVTFLVAVAPLLRALQGCSPAWPAPLAVRADFERTRPDPRREFLRARFNGRGGVELHPQQGSGVLRSVVWADGLVDLAPQQTVRVGDTVAFHPFSALIG